MPEHTPPPHDEAPARSEPPVRAGDAERDRVLAALSHGLSQGQLRPEEFGERQDRCLDARFLDELAPLIADLPDAKQLRAQLSGESPTALHPDAHGGGRQREIVPAKPGTGAADTDITILGGSDRIVPAGTRKVTAVSLMGGSDYDLTSVMGPGVELTIATYQMWAGQDIFVPPGVRIIDRTVNIMAGNDIARDARGDGSQGTLILTGVNIMAGNDVRLARGYLSQLRESAP